MSRLKLQTIPLVFNQGITDNTIDEAQDVKKIITAKNGWFNNDYLFESATGYTKLNELNSLGLNNIFQYKDSFLTSSNSKLYTYSGLNTFSEVGKIDSVGIQSEGIYRSGSLTVTNQDMYINPITNIACMILQINHIL